MVENLFLPFKLGPPTFKSWFRPCIRVHNCHIAILEV